MTLSVRLVALQHRPRRSCRRNNEYIWWDLMPSNQNSNRPEPAVAVAKQYLRRERPLSAFVVVLVLGVFLGTFRATSLLPAIVVGVCLLIVVRVPIFRVRGTARLRTDEDVDTVIESFTGPTPPVLVFQWGVADEITSQEGAVTYRISYLFGLRSVEVTVQTQTTTEQDGARQVELEVTANDQPWATYTVTIHRHNDQTAIKYEYTANRRFGLRRIPQRLIAERYRNKALNEQGYTVVERDEHYGI